MSLKSLVFTLFMVTHAVHALYPNEFLDFRRNPTKVNLDSLEEVTDAIIDELKSEIVSKRSNDKDKETENKSKSKMLTSESRIVDSWLEPNSEPSSLFDDPDENDALYSRDSTNFNKRNEYYEGLEKKSQRSTYVPPPRKNFYTTPEVIDASASEEYIHEERRDNRRPSRIVDHDDYYPERDPLTDVIHAESHHLIDSLDVAPSRGMYHASPVQTPPWRFTSGKSYPRRQGAPVIMNAQPQSFQTSPDPLLSKAAVMKPHGTYNMVPSAPRRPAALAHVPKIHYNDETKYKALPRSKPWVTEHTKQPITPKFAAKEDRVFTSPSGFGKPIRQQFHEQGTRGPHSYKFGYNTGDKENPMARYEERDADGIVRGSYSYVDARGEKQVVHYESHPKFGFKTKLNSGF